MAGVSVEIAAIKGAQDVCNGAVHDLNATAHKLNNRYREAGLYWKDSKYTQLGSIIDDCSKALKLPIEEILDCLNKLNELESAIIEYESVNLYNNIGNIDWSPFSNDTTQNNTSYRDSPSLLRRAVAGLMTIIAPITISDAQIRSNLPPLQPPTPITRRIEEGAEPGNETRYEDYRGSEYGDFTDPPD